MSLKGTIDKIKNGDTEAFTGLVKQYQNLAFAYAFSMLKDFHRAQDAAQEAFIIAYYQIHQLQDPEAFPGWLKGIVRHQCHRQWRGKMNRWESLETLDDNATEEPGPDQMLSHKEQNLFVLQAVQTLPERQREVVSLYYIEENSQQDVATLFFFVGPNEASSVSAMIEHEPDLNIDEGGPLQTSWLITDQAAQSDFAKTADYIEARPFFSKEMAEQKRFPAVDPLRSHSRLLDPSIVGKDHYRTAKQVRELLANEGTLNELQASRARKLKNFFTQPFYVMANSTKIPGVSASLKETITTCNKILVGEMDEIAEEMFLYTGGLPR